MKGWNTGVWFIRDSHVQLRVHSHFTHMFTWSVLDSSIVIQNTISNVWLDKIKCVNTDLFICRLPVWLPVFSSECNHEVLLTPVVHPGADYCFMDWVVALLGKLLSSPKWELWLDQQSHACWCELAAGELCVVLSVLIQYGLAWFWFVPACCDHISNTYRPYWGNGQIDPTQQHIVLVIIFRKHAHACVLSSFCIS